MNVVNPALKGMAHHHPQSSLSIFTQKFEDELECQVCLTEYVNPKVLPCHHAFCLKCIQHIPTVEKVRSIMFINICYNLYAAIGGQSGQSV